MEDLDELFYFRNPALWIERKMREVGNVDLFICEILGAQIEKYPYSEWDERYRDLPYWVEARQLKQSRDQMREVQRDQFEDRFSLGVGLASLPLIAMLYFWLIGASTPEDVLQSVLTASPNIVFPTGVVIAFFLFYVRGHHPRAYGLLEIFVGLMTIKSTTATLEFDALPSMLPFLGGIYVVIRGLDNLAKGLDRKSIIGRLFRIVFNNPPRL